MGVIIECRRCGFTATRGYPGIGIGFEARRKAEESFKGKNPTKEQLSKKADEISKRMVAEFTAEQRKLLEENAECPGSPSEKGRKRKREHEFEVIAYMD